MYKLILCLCIVSCICLIAKSTYGQNWVYVSTSDSYINYVDTESITYDGNKIYVWLKFVCVKDCTPYLENYGVYLKTTSFILSYHIYYCGEELSEMLIRTSYYSDGTTSDWDLRGHRDIDRIVANTTGETIYEFLCSNSK